MTYRPRSATSAADHVGCGLGVQPHLIIEAHLGAPTRASHQNSGATAYLNHGQGLLLL